ncbi:hypothetical protein BS47DRAFT_1336806 [Hydnum rufescens UP504]|uniref:Calcium-dependent phosphotriesterase n=1 Tax=Hydnum rufescens UP504 TaxID=1448309 RepID=A0A9P6B8J5_9AGAM|nr:hypothetical protein BS47DRAFT_1336806 [Hydnum rufescens UP504]
MARLISILLTGLLVVLGLAYTLVVHRLVHIHGVLKGAGSIRPQGNARCETIPSLEACEDLWIHRPTGLVYLACASRKGRMLWSPYFLIFKQPSHNDYVAIYDPRDLSVTRLGLDGFDDPRGLNVHGMDVVASRADPETLFISLVNHRPQPARNEYEHGADSVIEIFSTTLGSNTLTHVKTFRDPEVIITPNSVSWSPDGDSLYFTNDHPTRLGHAGRTATFLFNLARSSVGYCHVDHGCKMAAESVNGANGITTIDGDIFYVSNSFGGAIGVFRRLTDNTLSQVDSIFLGRSPDNLSFDEENNLYAATFINSIGFATRSSHDYTIPSPSSVYKISLNQTTANTSRAGGGKGKYAVDKIFEDDGTLATGITTAAWSSDGKKLYLTGILSPWLLVCQI